MVTGSSDFPTIFRAPQFALDAINGDGEIGRGDLADFLRRQIHKYDCRVGNHCVYSEGLTKQQVACIRGSDAQRASGSKGAFISSLERRGILMSELLL